MKKSSVFFNNGFTGCPRFNNRSSPERQGWLPALDGFRTTEQEVILFIMLYRHRSRGNLWSLGQSFPQKPAPFKRIYQNAIYEGLKIQAFINNGPGRITWAKARKELNISEAKLAHLLKIVNTLPSDFVENMKTCTDEDKLKIFNGRRLLQISRLKTDKERRNEIERLLPKA